MSATTGYFVAGSSWLHRRNPLTKLLALGPHPAVGVPAAAGRADRRSALVIVAAVWSAGLLRPMVRAMRIPALLLLSILVVNSLFFPGATDVLASLGPLSITREGLTFGLVSAGRVLVAFLAVGRVPVHDAGRRPARGAHRPRREPSHLVRRPVGRPDGAADAGPGRRDPRGAAGARPVDRGLVRATAPGARAAHRAGRARVARRRPRADVRARGARVRGAAGADGLPASSPIRRSTAGCAWRSSLRGASPWSSWR